MDKQAKIYVAGHRGLVGTALVRQLRAKGYENIITRTHAELDLTNQQLVANFFASESPEYVILAAAKVGGIHANNTYPAEFMFSNLAIQNNVIHQAYLHKVTRLLFLGSSCIYPRDCPQPIKEEYLLTGPLEPTNRPYALAKISGIEMCWSYNRQYGTQYLAAMPTNLYGLDDNYDLNSSHVLPALLRKFHLAKLASNGDVAAIKVDEELHGILPEPYKSELLEACSKKKAPKIKVWGTGEPRREFMYSEDMANACIFLMNLPDNKFLPLTAADRNDGIAPVVNVGVGEDISIKDLVKLIQQVTECDGEVVFDTTKPNGTSQKLMSVELLRSLGWATPSNLGSQLASLYTQYANKSNNLAGEL